MDGKIASCPGSVSRTAILACKCEDAISLSPLLHLKKLLCLMDESPGWIMDKTVLP